MRCLTSARLLGGASILQLLAARALATEPGPAPHPVWLRSGARISAAGERMLRDQMTAGTLDLPSDLVRHLGLDEPEAIDPAAAFAPAGTGIDAHRHVAPSGTLPNLAPDVQANDRTGDATCSSCGNRPLAQAETAIAALGERLLAGWNDTKGFCPPNGAVQGYAWSADGGQTWTDGGDVPALLTGGRYRGDPVHAVNRQSGRFYILGLYEGGTPGSGLAMCWGKFAGASFVFEGNRQIAVGGSSFLDKEWFAVDAGTGNVYVSWTEFFSNTDRIVFQAFDSLGVALGPSQPLSSPAANGNVQGSRPVVGPDGELYVIWYEYGVPLSHLRLRRSDDHGATFGPERTVCDFYENGLSGAPGYRRGFAPTFPSIAVDGSDGPHRGRLHVTWDEAVDFYDTTFPMTGTINEGAANDDYFASARPFAVGNTLRGSMSSPTDIDFWSFSASRGQTLYVACDSASASTTLQLRLVCAADTSNLNDYRLLAFSQARYPAFVFTLPADGTYYLRLASAVSTVGNYRLQTAFDTPSPGERGRDHRDQFHAYSDDGGTTWSAPVLLADSDPWFDGIFPEVTVDGSGGVHVFWHDFRDDGGCGALSYEYLASSGDGGTLWGANQRLSDAASFWSVNACGSANQGDYQAIVSEGANVYPCWADSRLGDPDVFVECIAFKFGGVCPPAQTLLAGTTQVLGFTLSNTGNVQGSFSWEASDSAGWLTSAVPGTSGSVTLPAGGTQDVQLTFDVPAGCVAAVDTVRFVTSDLHVAGRTDVCTTLLTCGTLSDAPGRGPAVLAFAAPRPNPATAGTTRFAFSLSRPGGVRLAVYRVDGTRVRLLLDGARGSGPHEITWDGRDARDRRVPAGIYFARLDAEGRTLRRVVSVLR
jgi:hypothetical protein